MDDLCTVRDQLVPVPRPSKTAPRPAEKYIKTGRALTEAEYWLQPETPQFYSGNDCLF